MERANLVNKELSTLIASHMVPWRERVQPPSKATSLQHVHVLMYGRQLATWALSLRRSAQGQSVGLIFDPGLIRYTSFTVTEAI